MRFWKAPTAGRAGQETKFPGSSIIRATAERRESKQPSSTSPNAGELAVSASASKTTKPAAKIESIRKLTAPNVER